MKEYLSFEGLSHFFNKLLSKIESTYAKSSDLTNPISRITQNENDIADLETQVNLKVPTSRTINGKALANNITLSASDVNADPVGTAQTKADAALSSAKSYTDTKIADLVDSAPDTLNTLNELAVAIQENDDVVEALNSAVGNKVDKVEGMGLSTNDYTDAEKNKLAELHTVAITGSWNDIENKKLIVTDDGDGNVTISL